MTTTDYISNIENKFFFKDTMTNTDIRDLTNITIHELNYTHLTETRIDIIKEIVMQIIDKYFIFESKEERDILNSIILSSINEYIISTQSENGNSKSCVCIIS